MALNTENTTAHGIAVPVVRGGADGTKSPEKEPVVMMIGQTNSGDQSDLLHSALDSKGIRPTLRMEERRTVDQLLNQLPVGEGDHTPVAYIEYDGTTARIDRWCWRGADAAEHENSLELVFLETSFAFHPSGAYEIELSTEGAEHLATILAAALPLMKEAA